MSRFDPGWLEVQYNNRARVPEHPAIFERWARASTLAREASPCHLDLAYGDGPNETLDVFPPPRPSAPALVFIHGGWWRSLDKRDHSFVAPAFARAGALVLLPNCALCPAVTIETIALQMVRALDWVHRHAGRYGGDPQRIVVAGHSATRPVATSPRCCWAAAGARSRAICRRDWCARRWRSRACSNWSRCAIRRSCRRTCGSHGPRRAA